MIKKYLSDGLIKSGIVLSEETIEKMVKYIEILKEENEKVNLTALKTDIDIIEKHFIDSLLPFKLDPINAGDTVIDVGTGAGFPGMVLAIAFPEAKFTLLDSIGKKTKFLEKISKELDLFNVEIVCSRAEDFLKSGKRECYDLGTARAVAEMRILSEFVLPFVKVGGRFDALKANYENELSDGINAITILGGAIHSVDEYLLPFTGDRRTMIKICKVRPTPDKYPRKPGIIEKKPL